MVRGTKRRSGVENGVASYCVMGEKPSNYPKDLREAIEWQHKNWPVRSAEKKEHDARIFGTSYF